MSTVAPQASSRWRRTWVELKAAAIPVIAFWAMTFLAFGLLFALYLVDEGQADGILIFGGNNLDIKQSAKAWSFDLDSREWTLLAPAGTAEPGQPSYEPKRQLRTL